MSLYSFFFIVAFAIFLYVGYYSLHLNKKSCLNIVFFLYCLCLSVWAITYGFLFSEINKDKIWLLYKISGIGWCFMQAIGLHFALVLAKRDNISKNPFLISLLYIPSFYFYFNVLVNTLFCVDFLIINKDITFVYGKFSINLLLYFIYHTIYLSLFIYLIWRWGKESNKEIEKKQSRILLFPAFIAAFFGTITDGIQVFLKMDIVKPVGILLILIWVLAMWYAIIKYNLLKIRSYYPAFEEISSKMTDVLIIVSHNGLIFKVNSKVESLLMFDEKELISEDINKILLMGEKNWYKKVERDKPLHFETELLAKDGSRIPVNLHTSILIDENKEDIGIILIGQDIRLTRQLKEEIKERQETEKILKENELRYKALVSKIPELILIHKNDYIYYVNNSIESFSGYKPEEVVGTSIYNYIYDEYKPVIIQSIKRRMAGEDVPDQEIVLIDKFNNKKTVIIRSSITFYDTQVMILTLLIDITERKKVEEEIKRAKEIAENASKTKSEFLATMSHEIRTPINGILGMLNLTSSTNLTVEQKKYISMAKDSCEYLANIVDSILDYSKIEAGKLDLEKISFDLHKLVNSVIEEFRIKANDKKIVLNLYFDNTIDQFIKGDVFKIKQILVNLVNNAIKFTENGKIDVKVEKTKNFDDKVEFKIMVSDTGIGIPKDKINKLFQTFSQVDGSSRRKYGGTGLGLVISKKLIEMMGGNIWLETEENVGTKFYFTCILDKSDKDDFFTKEIETENKPEEKKQFRILIAEDNNVNQEFLSVLLTKKGFFVTCVDNGLEAIEKLKGERFDLILMDIEMPEMDGYEATVKIREIEKNEKQKKIPIIALTAYAMKGDREKCASVGMDDYLSKPIKVDLLFSKLEKYLI